MKNTHARFFPVYLWTLALVVIVGTAHLAGAGHASAARPAPVERPPIVGVAHIALKTDNLEAAREFYGHVLGFAEAFRFDESPAAVPIYFKVNDHQYVEIFPVKQLGPKEDRLVNIGFETTNVKELRDYLANRGVEVPPLPDSGLGPMSGFMVHDPDGHEVEFDAYPQKPGELITRNFGKFMPATRISDHMIHVGVTVADRAAADRFYGDILGFKLMWHGGMKDDRTDWVDMRVPEGTDWLEYMLNVRNPSPRTLGVMHHFALGVKSVQPAYQTVTARGYKAVEPKIGRDGKWQLNLYDPDLTRAELMEFKPVQTPCCSPMILP
jgi:catechol 2,3-dioxygenase-like lactoylglutathione lyase family enzyme